MKQLYWNYLDRFGRNHKIGIYHGPSGHLVIYCNATIIAIDFNVLQPKKYTFFIGEELFHLSIEEQNAAFQYDCKIDKDAPTQRNQERQLEQKQELRRMMWASCLVVGLIVFFWLAQ